VNAGGNDFFQNNAMGIHGFFQVFRKVEIGSTRFLEDYMEICGEFFPEDFWGAGNLGTPPSKNSEKRSRIFFRYAATGTSSTSISIKPSRKRAS